MANGTPITAFTPRTPQGQPVNPINSTPLLDNFNPLNLAVNDITPIQKASDLVVLSAALYGMAPTTKIRTVLAFTLSALAAGKKIDVTIVVDGNEQFTNTYEGDGTDLNITIEIQPDTMPTANVNFGGTFSAKFAQDAPGTSANVENIRYLIFASN